MPETRTITIRDNITPALRDALIRQLEGGGALIVGNLADLNRLGSQQVAESGPSEVFQVPELSEEDAKAGAKRAQEEAAAVANPPEPEPDTGEEPLNEKDPAVVKAANDREAELGATVNATTLSTSTRSRRASGDA